MMCLMMMMNNGAVRGGGGEGGEGGERGEGGGGRAFSRLAEQSMSSHQCMVYILGPRF